MNTRILLLALGVTAFSSCSVYRSGQTPDDVYYSPARPQAESYVEVQQEKAGSNYQTYEQYQDNYRDDRFLRMSVGNVAYRNAYNMYSGFDWRYNSFYDGYNFGFNSPWNNYFAWNNFYNPYSSYGFNPHGISYGGMYGGGGYFAGGGYYGGNYGYGGGGYYGGGIHYPAARTPISRPVTFNLNNYSNGNNSRSANRNYSNSANTYYNNNNQRYNNSNSGRNYNNNNSSNRNNNHPTYSPANNSGNNNTYTPSRSYSPSSSSGSSSSGSSSGSSGSVSRPARGN